MPVRSVEPNHPESKIARFGCGFIVGLSVGGVVLMSAIFDGDWMWVLILLTPGLLFGFLAMRDGDAFWRWLKDLWLFRPW